jgi:hypothetical protein
MVKEELEKWMRLIRLTLQGDPIDSIQHNSDLWRMHIKVFQYIYDDPELVNGSEQEA